MLVAFHRALQVNHTLNFLSLAKNKISDDGAEGAAGMLKLNRGLILFDLR